MIHWRKTMDVWPVKHTKNFRLNCRFYIIMNYQMTESKNQDQQIENVMWSVTERALREEIKNLENELDYAKKTIRGYKDYVGKVFTNDPKQIRLIMLAQQIAETCLPVDDFRAQTDNHYLHEMILIRWHFALTLEWFCNDYLEKLSDKKFRNEVLKDIQNDWDTDK